MKKILFTVLLCSVLCVLSAQSRKQVRQYYYWINQAELAICDSNYQRASECYHTAFAIKRPCIRDAAFAFKLHTEYLYDLERACEAFHFLALSGDKAYFSDGDPYVDDTVTYAELWQHIKLISDTTQSLVIEDLWNKAHEMSRLDQQVRFASYENDSVASATIAHTDSLNFQKMQQVFKQYKNFSEYHSGFGGGFSSALFIHFARMGFASPDVFLLKMVKRGDCPPANYICTYDCCYHSIIKNDDKTTYGTDPSYTYIINNTLFIRYPDNVKQIDRNRKKLNFAETWADYVKKVLYVNQRKEGFWFYPKQFVIHGDEAEEEQREKEERARYDSGEIKGAYYDLDPDIFN